MSLLRVGDLMVNKAFLVVLQYGMLLCMCGFIVVTVKYMFKDLKSTSALDDKKKKEVKPNEVTLIVLEAIDPKLKNKKISFSGQISIGRGNENDIVLDDIYVSHHHAVISPIRNLYQIEDLRSRNHTYINGSVLDGKAYLQNGDIIKIGGVTFRFER